MKIADIYRKLSYRWGLRRRNNLLVNGTRCSFDILEQLYFATDGIINIYDEPLIKDMGRYFIAYIGKDNFINFADASSKVKLSNDLIIDMDEELTIKHFGYRRKMFLEAYKTFSKADKNGEPVTRRPSILIRELHVFNYRWVSALSQNR